MSDGAKHTRQASSSSAVNYNDISPELVPVVTLLSAQNHRRYIENNFMLLHDLNNEGQPAERKWTEVYGVLSGTQLAIWDAERLLATRHVKEKFQQSTSKPDYLNLADASYKALLSLPSAGKSLSNVILISTTLKNRYILQFATKELLMRWHAALRLSTYEYVSLQEAYTGALLSARGAKLSDIKVVLAESKYNHEHWISVRFGAGRPWKRCYAVVEQGLKKAKRSPNGKIFLYEHEKTKKAPLIATIVSSSCVYAVYPNSPVVIDNSTLIKMEGKVVFNKKEGATDATVFIMPESHSAVPGYDTLIRFLIPSLDAFRLYGRPKKLNADKRDPDSLLFGLPVLPHVHYLQLEDVISLSQMSSSILWPVDEWTSHLKDILKTKMQAGYSGCGSAHGITGALSSPALGSSNPASRTASPTNPNFTPTPTKQRFSLNLNDSADFGSSVTLIEKNHSNSSLPAHPTNHTSPYGDNPYQTNSQPSLGTSKQTNNQLPLPSDSRNPNLQMPTYSYSNMSLPESLLPSKNVMSKENLLPNKNVLPLPSDYHKQSNSDTSIHPEKNFPSTSDYQNKLSSSNDLLLPLDRSNKRVSEITQLYTDYAKIPSPKDKELNLATALQNLNIKQVDDDDFDLNDIISKTKAQEKRNSKKDIDIFNPAYSEQLLSPAVENANPFNATSAATSARSSVRNSAASEFSTSKRPNSKLQPTLPMISVDDDDDFAPASPYNQPMASPMRTSSSQPMASPMRTSSGQSMASPMRGAPASPNRNARKPQSPYQNGNQYQIPSPNQNGNQYQNPSPNQNDNQYQNSLPQQSPYQTVPRQRPQHPQHRKPPGPDNLRINTAPLTGPNGPNGPRAFPQGSQRSPMRSPYGNYP